MCDGIADTFIAMRCVSCGKKIRVLSGVCSSCGHTADQVDFKTQLAAWAGANEQPEVEQPEVEQPEVEQPEVEQPEVEQPEVEQPEVEQKPKQRGKAKSKD